MYWNKPSICEYWLWNKLFWKGNSFAISRFMLIRVCNSWLKNASFTYLGRLQWWLFRDSLFHKNALQLKGRFNGTFCVGEDKVVMLVKRGTNNMNIWLYSGFVRLLCSKSQNQRFDWKSSLGCFKTEDSICNVWTSRFSKTASYGVTF